MVKVAGVVMGRGVFAMAGAVVRALIMTEVIAVLWKAARYVVVAWCMVVMEAVEWWGMVAMVVLSAVMARAVEASVLMATAAVV